MVHIGEVIEQLHRELPPDVKLVAVSKFHPLDAILEAYDAGQRVFAESRPQELAAKVAELERLSLSEDNSLSGLSPLSDLSSRSDGSSLIDGVVPRNSDIEWHFIGHLQTNKLKMVLPFVSLVQSVDSLRLLQAIDNWGRNASRVTDVLLEYRIASEETKNGFERAELESILLGSERFEHVRIRGLMGMATFTDDEEVIRSEFSKLTEFKAYIDGFIGKAPNLASYFTEMSFGMTHDWRIAVDMGATMVRIGTLIFGERV